MNDDKSSQQQGEITEAKYKDGPCPNRSCTDVLCCLIFVIFCALMLIIAVYALMKGNPATLATPYDPNHRGCGVDKEVVDYPYIYFTSPSPKNLWRTVCVKECPKEGDELKCAVNKYVTDCNGIKLVVSKKSDTSSTGTKATADTSVTASGKSSTPKTFRIFNHLIDPTSNAPIYLQEKEMHQLGTISLEEKTYIYDTKPMFGRICFPVMSQLMKNVQDSVNLGDGQNALNDIKKTWQISLASFFIAFIVAFTFLFLMRYFGGCIIWILIIAINVTLILITAIFLLAGFNGTASTDDQKSNLTKQKIIGCVVGAVALIVFILTLCMCKRIRIAIAVLESATIFIKDNFSSLFLPIFTLIIVIIYISCWVAIALFLYSIGEKVNKEKSLPFATMKHEQSIVYIGYFHFAGLFWILSFILASSDFILASATSIWYFQQGSGQEQYNPMRTSYYRLFRYHLGTVAFGSFILALVWMIQVIFEYVANQAKQYAGENAFVQFLIKCIRCCLACFERFIRFLNKNAYVQTAMKGKSFCSAAMDAFLLMIRNALRFSAVGGIGAFIIFLGRIFVCAVTALIGYIIITKMSYFADAINSPVWPTVMFGLIGFVIGSLFMSVYGDVADAVLIVFCMDEEIQQTHYNGQAQHCPAPLLKFMETNAKK